MKKLLRKYMTFFSKRKIIQIFGEDFTVFLTGLKLFAARKRRLIVAAALSFCNKVHFAVHNNRWLLALSALFRTSVTLSLNGLRNIAISKNQFTSVIKGVADKAARNSEKAITRFQSVCLMYAFRIVKVLSHTRSLFYSVVRGRADGKRVKHISKLEFFNTARTVLAEWHRTNAFHHFDFFEKIKAAAAGWNKQRARLLLDFYEKVKAAATLFLHRFGIGFSTFTAVIKAASDFWIHGCWRANTSFGEYAKLANLPEKSSGLGHIAFGESIRVAVASARGKVFSGISGLAVQIKLYTQSAVRAFSHVCGYFGSRSRLITAELKAVTNAAIGNLYSKFKIDIENTRVRTARNILTSVLLQGLKAISGREISVNPAQLFSALTRGTSGGDPAVAHNGVTARSAVRIKLARDPIKIITGIAASFHGIITMAGLARVSCSVTSSFNSRAIMDVLSDANWEYPVLIDGALYITQVNTLRQNGKELSIS